MKKPINQIAFKIGMQNQYLAYAVYDGKIKGEIYNKDYHSDKSWVDIDSVKEYIKWQYDNWVIGEEHCEKAMKFLNDIK